MYITEERYELKSGRMDEMDAARGAQVEREKESKPKEG